jgi:hypothetical protein
MPADQRLGPHDDERVTPLKQLGEEDQAHSSRGIGASGFDTSLFAKRELTAQKEILGGERVSWSDRKRD